MTAPGMGERVCVGREEVGRLVGLARGVAAGRGALLWVEGEPGIGKTTLLDVLAADCARLGVRVVRGGAEKLEQRLPFAALGAALGVRPGAADERLVRLARLLRGEDAFGSSAAAANHELVVTETILELVDHWCASGPVALVVDDVQWADAASVVAVHRLGRAVERDGWPLLVVVAARPVPRGEAVAGLVDSLAGRGAQQLVVRPLPEPAVAELVGHLVGAPPGPRLLGLLAGAGGNPMYVAEVVAALSREGLLETTGPVAEVAEVAEEWVPSSLVGAIQRRLRFLPAKVRETLEMAAVLGPSVDVAELSAVLDMPVGVLSGMVDEAMAAGLLAEASGGLVFRHDVIRQALAGQRPGSVRAALRLRAGQVLAAAGAPVERVAEHLLAGALLEPATVDWLVHSADVLIVRVPELAVQLLRHVLVTTEGEVAEVLGFHLVRALLEVGQSVEAEHAALAALAAGSAPGREGALYWLLLQARFRQGRPGDAVAAAEEALHSPYLTPTEVGRFHGFASLCLNCLGRFEESEAAAGKAAAAGEAGADTIAVVYGYTMLAVQHLGQGELAQGVRFTGQALAVLESDAQPGSDDVDPYLIRAYCLVGLDRFAEAEEALTCSLRRNERAGGVHLPLIYLTWARLYFLHGRWDDVLAKVRTGSDVPDPYRFGVTLPLLAALVAVHRGTPTPGSPAEAGEPGSTLGHSLAVWAAALAEEARGDPRCALDLLYPTWEKPSRWVHPPAIYDFCPDLARLAAVVGDPGRARELATTTEDLAARETSPSMNATALLCRGLVGGDPALLLEAAACFRQAGRPLYEGYGYEEAAVLLARRGDTTEARAALDQALALYAGLGAAWDTARTQARLRQAGVRRGRRQALRKRPAHGWEALTETELKVAMLVAEGLSNPDIAAQMVLSRRTVQSHVSSILAKLELTSRVEVALNAHSRTAG